MENGRILSIVERSRAHDGESSRRQRDAIRHLYQGEDDVAGHRLSKAAS